MCKFYNVKSLNIPLFVLYSMKREFSLIVIILLFLYLVNAANNELRVRVDTKLLGNEGITVNLTEFLGSNSEYFILNKLNYVTVTINSLGIAQIKSKAGKSGSEVVIFSINNTKIEESSNSNVLENNGFLFTNEINYTIDNSVIDAVKYLELRNKKIDFTNVKFSEGELSINIGNISNIYLNFEKSDNKPILKGISVNFSAAIEDNKHLFYENKKTDYSFLLNIFVPLLIGICSIILLILLIILLHKKEKHVFDKENFKKMYLNKLFTLKRSVTHDNLEHTFNEFSINMRTFLSKLLNIKYQFTYDELMNELVIKNIDKKLRYELTKLAKNMLEKSYKDKPSIHDLKDLIEKAIHIIQRF